MLSLHKKFGWVSFDEEGGFSEFLYPKREIF
jgi:hypothetical protein